MTPRPANAAAMSRLTRVLPDDLCMAEISTAAMARTYDLYQRR